MPQKKGSGIAVTKGKSIGGSTNGMQYTRGYMRRAKEKLKAEEAYWQSLNGPVIIRNIKDKIAEGVK
jgi:hypothetical protein